MTERGSSPTRLAPLEAEIERLRDELESTRRDAAEARRSYLEEISRLRSRQVELAARLDEAAAPRSVGVLEELLTAITGTSGVASEEPPPLVRKLRKFRRDPSAFLADSGSGPLRSLSRALRRSRER